jgi:hypothetical protein
MAIDYAAHLAATEASQKATLEFQTNLNDISAEGNAGIAALQASLALSGKVAGR